MLELFLLILSHLACSSLAFLQRVLPHPSVSTAIQAAMTSVWWRDGVDFKCTGCGKCCMNEGEVWLDIDEFHDLAEYLNLTFSATIDKYVENIQSNWVKLKSQDIPLTSTLTSSPSLISSSSNTAVQQTSLVSQCIFLAEDRKTCSIYPARPAQCRTYPYWPRLLESQEAFLNESVSPDHVNDAATKHWTPDNGGCEGIQHKDAVRVPARSVYRNLELYKAYIESFPFMNSGDDRNRLINAAEVIAAVVKSTRAWVKHFVIKYDLCPFARGVMESDGVRYRVYLGTDKERLKKKLRYEVSAVYSY